jgi:hypothetical protein
MGVPDGASVDGIDSSPAANSWTGSRDWTVNPSTRPQQLTSFAAWRTGVPRRRGARQASDVQRHPLGDPAIGGAPSTEDRLADSDGWEPPLRAEDRPTERVIPPQTEGDLGADRCRVPRLPA